MIYITVTVCFQIHVYGVPKYYNIAIKFKFNTLQLFLFLKRINLNHLEIKILKITLLFF